MVREVLLDPLGDDATEGVSDGRVRQRGRWEHLPMRAPQQRVTGAPEHALGRGVYSLNTKLAIENAVSVPHALDDRVVAPRA